MAKRIVIWTYTAKEQRRLILKYWTVKNSSTIYAEKLIRLISERTKLIALHPEAFMATDFKHAKAIVLNSLGAPFLEISNRTQKGFFSRHCCMASKAGIFKGIDISKEIQGNIVNEFPLLLKDEYINNYLTTKASIFFLKYENEKEMQEKTARINELIKVLIDD